MTWEDVVEVVIYVGVAGILFLTILFLRHKPKKHSWYEVRSSDIVHAEKEKRRKGE